MGEQSGANGNRPAQLTRGTASRRQFLQSLRQKKQLAGKRSQVANGQNDSNRPNQQRNQAARLRKRQPQAPVVHNNQQANLQPNTQVNVIQGTLAERKIKVRNIDARVVSVSDLQKLFSKCGPILNASFDTNEFGAYLGTATVIYTKASSAARSIKDYNLAKIDNRPMKVQYAIMQAVTANSQ